ncbi:MAG: V-type ATPase subunit [Oscillospiraceae bacterium]|nr:V-type ATPase subunit [Oscillospiraceae bacterium]
MSVEYSAVAAKLKAMHSKFLTYEDYEELLAKKSVNDICGYLKTTAGYGEVLSGVNERDAHRGAMEVLLDSELVNEYVRLYNFMDHSKRSLMELWFMRYEVEFLKRAIRHIYTHEENSDDEIDRGKFNAFFETHTKINREVMMNAKSLSDCIEACKDTPFAKTLQRAENLDADFFSMGMMLDWRYYSAIWRAIGKNLNGDKEKLFKKLIGSEIDMLNLMWIYRGKKYFKFPNEIIFTYILPIRYRISEEVMRQLVNAESIEKFTDTVNRSTIYGALFEGCGEGRFPEENYRYIYNKLSKSIFVNHSESMVAVYTYLNLKETELKNITTIIEGIRYSINTESIRGHIGIK